jgi:hypothetical protein
VHPVGSCCNDSLDNCSVAMTRYNLSLKYVTVRLFVLFNEDTVLKQI